MHWAWKIICVASLAPVASAQWTVTNLHPSGATTSYGFGVSGTQQVGTAVFGA